MSTEGVRGKFYKFIFTETVDRSFDTNIQLSLIEFFADPGKQVSPERVENPGGRNPEMEQPDNLLDGRVTSKWLDFNFASGKSELIFEFSDEILLVKYDLFTANDEESRDPKSWNLFASSDKSSWKLIDERSNVPRKSDRYSLLGSFEVGVKKPADKSEKAILEKIPLDVQAELAVKYIKFSFTETHESSPEVIQIGSIQFYQGNNQVRAINVENPGGGGPPSDSVKNLLDDSFETRWIDVKFAEHEPRLSVLIFQFSDPIFITSYRIFTSNTFDQRDPKSWKVEGSKDEVSWTEIDARKDQELVMERKALLGKYTLQTVSKAFDYFVKKEEEKEPEYCDDDDF